jgi:hypothetical protein
MNRPANPPGPDPASQQRALESLAANIVRALGLVQVEEARRHFDALCSLVPGHPALEHIARQIAVIGFEWPLPRSAWRPGPRTPPAPGQVDLVAFHADMPAAPSEIHQKIDYLAVLALSFESAAIRAPQARRVLLTDEHTPIPAAMQVDEVIRYPIDLKRLMYERMRIQALYLGNRPPSRVSVLMDSDVVVNREPSAVFATDFDIGLTWRPEFADAPFNGGMIFVGEGDKGLGFYQRARACYDALAADPAVTSPFPRDLRAWWGDQFALAATVGHRSFAQRQGQGIAVDGIRVQFFPCDEYNFTMEPNVNYPHAAMAAKYFVHFKGNRKAMQSQYLQMMRANRA